MRSETERFRSDTQRFRLNHCMPVESRVLFSDDLGAPPREKAGFNTEQCCKLSVTILKAT